MAATPFRPVSWAPDELITESKLDQIANNAQWLFENDVRGKYDAHGVRRTSGVKIAAGTCLVYASVYGTQTRGIYFGGFFSTASRPMVTTGIISFQLRTWVVVNGFGVLFPDHRGFEVQVCCMTAAMKPKIERNFYINWTAVGF